MRPASHAARLAELALLDVLDVREDGSLRLNDAFREECIAAFDADPSCLDRVFQERILARAVERGFAALADLDELALAALEIAVGDEEEAQAA